jgi:ferredoxin--NADP+ reductase
MTNPSYRVVIVGSGPSAFYAASELLRQTEPEISVDLLERLPTPYGLVRGGVAPDHQKIKSVTKIYERTAQHPRFRFFGNVEFGRDVTRQELLERYDAILYAVGCRSDKRLGIPGEDLAGSFPATQFVGWYNGHPDYQHLTFDLSVKSVAIVGMGNVAVDCARILSQDPEELAKTDIADQALEALRTSQVENVYLIGRRGPVQAAFTPVEVRELLHLPRTDALVRDQDLQLDPASQRELEQASRQTQQNLEILRQIQARGATGKPRKLHILFCESPQQLLGTERVEQLELVRNELVEEHGRIRAQATAHVSRLEVGLVLRSIGYNGDALPDVPFDAKRGVLPNAGGQLLDAPDGDLLAHEYVAGWIKRGPSGVIGTNKQCAVETVQRMLGNLATPKTRTDDLASLLQSRGVPAVSFADWKKLDEYEVQRGQPSGRPRRKVTSVEEMLRIIQNV